MGPAQSPPNPSGGALAAPLSPAGYDFALTLKRRGVFPHLLLSSAHLSEHVQASLAALAALSLGFGSGTESQTGRSVTLRDVSTSPRVKGPTPSVATPPIWALRRLGWFVGISTVWL